MVLKFQIPGPPLAKRRHRTVPLSRCQSCGKLTPGNYHECKYCKGPLKFVSNTTYSDSEQVQYENLVAYCASQAMKEAGVTRIVDRGCIMTAKFYMSIPVSRQCKKNCLPEVKCRRLHDGDRVYQRPDNSNCIKSVEDGLNGVLYSDDCLISETHIYRYWSNEPRTEITVETI